MHRCQSQHPCVLILNCALALAIYIFVGWRDRDRHRNRETRQTDTDRQTDRQTDRRTEGRADGQTDPEPTYCVYSQCLRRYPATGNYWRRGTWPPECHFGQTSWSSRCTFYWTQWTARGVWSRRLAASDISRVPPSGNIGPCLRHCWKHYSDVTIGAMASQITSLTIGYSIIYSGAHQRKHQSSASLAICAGFPAQMASNA